MLRLHIILALLLLFALVLSVASFRIWSRRVNVLGALRTAREMIAEREETIRSLEQKLDAAKDPRIAEQEAKVRFYLRRPEEHIVFLASEGGESLAPKTADDRNGAGEVLPSFLMNVQRWWRYFSEE